LLGFFDEKSLPTGASKMSALPSLPGLPRAKARLASRSTAIPALPGLLDAAEKRGDDFYVGEYSKAKRGKLSFSASSSSIEWFEGQGEAIIGCIVQRTR
jgi:hypothetical protein